MGDGVDMKQFPKLAAHHEAMLRRPAVQKVMADLG
jgi:glutathione S-transferase